VCYSTIKVLFLKSNKPPPTRIQSNDQVEQSGSRQEEVIRRSLSNDDLDGIMTGDRVPSRFDEEKGGLWEQKTPSDSEESI
jgi:hypothetical protein